MRTQTDPYHDIQDRITGQIGALAEALPHCALAQIVQSIDDIRCLARDNGFATDKDQIVVTAGVPFNVKGTTNILRVAPCDERLIFNTDPE